MNEELLEQIEDKYIELISLNKMGSRVDGTTEMYLEVCKIISVAKNGDGNDSVEDYKKKLIEKIDEPLLEHYAYNNGVVQAYKRDLVDLINNLK